MAARAGDSPSPAPDLIPAQTLTENLHWDWYNEREHFRSTVMITLFDHHFLDKKRLDSAPMKISLATELKILETPPRASDFVRRTKYSVS